MIKAVVQPQGKFMCSIKALPDTIRLYIQSLEKVFGKDEEYFREKLAGIKPEDVENELDIIVDMLEAEKNLSEIAAGKQSINTIVDCTVVDNGDAGKEVLCSRCDKTETYSRKKLSLAEARKLLKLDADKGKNTLPRRHGRPAVVLKKANASPIGIVVCAKSKGRPKAVAGLVHKAALQKDPRNTTPIG